MKKSTLLALFLLFSFALFAQPPKDSLQLKKLEALLMGRWKIEKVVDKEGKEVKTIVKKMAGSPMGNEMYVKATGPEIALISDRTYQLTFSPERISRGDWKLTSPDTLVLKGITIKGSPDYQMLFTAAEMFGKKLTYDPYGNIVESNVFVIVEQKPNILKLKYEDDYVQIYQRR